MKKYLTDVKQHLEAEKKKRADAIRSVESGLKGLSNTISDKKKAVNEAYVSGQMTTYRSAKNDLDNSISDKDLFEKRLQNMKDSGAISEDYAVKAISDIKAACENDIAEATRKLASLARQMCEVSIELDKTIAEANEMIDEVNDAAKRGNRSLDLILDRRAVEWGHQVITRFDHLYTEGSGETFISPSLNYPYGKFLKVK